MKATLLLALALPLVSSAALAATSDADLLRCLAVADTAARLACYDGLATAVRTNKPPIAAAAIAANPAVVLTPEAKAEQDFGRASIPTARNEPVKVLESSLTGTISEWRRGQQLKLANGQVWMINDEPANFKPLTNPAVKITPGLLGSFYMDIAGVGFQVKVKRVQ